MATQQTLYRMIRNLKDKEVSLSNSSIVLISPGKAIPIIRKTWKLLLSRKKEVGVVIYKKVVLKEVTLGKLFEETDLDIQAVTFMDMLSTVIGFLSDLKTMSKKLQKLGESHNLSYNVNLRHLKHFRQAFLLGIRTYIPWNDKRDAAWNWFWDEIVTNMGKATTDRAIRNLSKNNIDKQTLVEYGVTLTNSFDYVLDDPDEFANEFYQELLKADKSIATLFENTSFKEQAAKFISMLIHATRLLDNPRNLKKKLDLLGKKHDKYGVKAVQVQVFGNILIGKIKTRMGKDWGKKQTNAWTWFWKQISDTMIKSLGNENKKSEKIKNNNNTSKNDSDNDKDYVKVNNNNDEMKTDNN